MPAPSPRPRRAPRAASRAVSCAVIGAVALAFAGFGTPAGAARSPRPVVQMPVGELTVYRTGANPQALPDDVRDKVMAALASYVKVATVKALQKGTADPTALAALLGPGAAARLTGPDRGVLLDEGLPRATSKIVVTGAPVALTGLADGQGNVVVVTAKLDATTKTRTTKGKLTITRAGEIVFAPEGDTWKIDGYDLTVDRSGKGLGAVATTPTTTVPAAPAAPTPGMAAR
jgi:hypothetical protein